MAYDTDLAERLMEAVAPFADITTRKMFGGYAVMWRGNMLAGVLGEDLMVRVGPDGYESALQQSGAREMEFTGRPMRGMVMVQADQVTQPQQVAEWVARAAAFVGTLPAK